MQVDLTQVIVALIGVIASVVSVYLIPLLKSKVSSDRWEQFIKIVSVAVDAAEQLGMVGKVNDKLDYAMAQIKIAMEKHGLTYSDETIRAAIESIVLQFNYSVIDYTVDDLIKLKEAGIVDVVEEAQDES